MKVEVKDWTVSMEIKNKGIELQVTGNDGAHLEDLCGYQDKANLVQRSHKAREWYGYFVD